jgi:hypothetical protein
MTDDPLGNVREQLTRGIGGASARRTRRARASVAAALLIVAIVGGWLVASRPDEERVMAADEPSSITSTEPALPTAGSGSNPTCTVTRATGPGLAVPDPWPERPSAGVWYGTVDLWTVLPTDGFATAPRKSVWWSANHPGGSAEPMPDIAVTWQRLDRPAATVRAGSPGTNGSTPEDGSFMIAGIDPPGAGCWRVTATYRGATLSYVYWNPPRLWVQPSGQPSDDQNAIVQGTVGFDETSNCFFLEGGELRYPVVWPARTTISDDGSGIELGDGRTVRLGDHVSGGGGYQQFEGEPVHDIPSDCLPATGAVAVFNPEAELDITR